jgi:hypothetical protein
MLLPNAEPSKTNLTQTDEWMRQRLPVIEKDAR